MRDALCLWILEGADPVLRALFIPEDRQACRSSWRALIRVLLSSLFARLNQHLMRPRRLAAVSSFPSLRRRSAPGRRKSTTRLPRTSSVRKWTPPRVWLRRCEQNANCGSLGALPCPRFASAARGLLRKTQPRTAARRRTRRLGKAVCAGRTAPRHRGGRVRQDQHTRPSRRASDCQRRRPASHPADDLLPPGGG